MAFFALPALDYDFGALEPHISGRIVELHHREHHAAYVRHANSALERLEEARARSDLAKVADLERNLAFNLSGHVLHSILWRNLSPGGGGRREGELAREIDRSLCSFTGFKEHLTGANGSTTRSDWGALAWEPLSTRLLVRRVYDHQSNVAPADAPHLVIDAWEHAYNRQCENQREGFFKTIWNLWNWNGVAKRREAARRLDAG